MATRHKPCPFCGYTEINQGCCVMDQAQGTKWGHVVCPGCNARGPEVRTEYQEYGPWIHFALDEWNKRTGE